MDEEVRRRLAYEVQRRRQRGDSQRAISRALGLHRNTVRRLLEELAARREHGESALEREVRAPAPRDSKLERYREQIAAWLEEFEDLTAVRLHEKLCGCGFDGGYTIVREHLKKLREGAKPKQAFALVETPVGQQAQFDWSPYTLPGCGAQVNLWSCTLSWSRGRAFEASDNIRQPTILRCLVHSFERFGGVPRQCVTDSMAGVVDRWECDQPLLNVRFVDFAAFYNFTITIAPRGMARYKGKVERPFWYLEQNLLNGRTFDSAEEFREVLAWWREAHAMRRAHPRTHRPIAEMLEQERPFLQPLPARPYDTREVLVRLVDSYGYVRHQTNFYRVADRHVGQLVYLCVDVARIEVFDRGIHRLAEHARLPDGAGSRVGEPGKRRRYDLTLLMERFAEWGEAAATFAERLRARQRYAGPALSHILSLQLAWSAEDVVAALEHAMRYDAYDARALERILEARFRPRSLEGQMADTARTQIRNAMRAHPVRQRPLSEYAALRAGDGAAPLPLCESSDEQGPKTPETDAQPDPPG